MSSSGSVASTLDHLAVELEAARAGKLERAADAAFGEPRQGRPLLLLHLGRVVAQQAHRRCRRRAAAARAVGSASGWSAAAAPARAPRSAARRWAAAPRGSSAPHWRCCGSSRRPNRRWRRATAPIAGVMCMKAPSSRTSSTAISARMRPVSGLSVRRRWNRSGCERASTSDRPGASAATSSLSAAPPPNSPPCCWPHSRKRAKRQASVALPMPRGPAISQA